MDLDCTQQGILFSDERKNIQQPVFALGVLDTLPCFGFRHMQVVGVKLLSAGQKHSSPPRVPVEGGGEPRGAAEGPSSSGRGEAAPPPPRSEALTPAPSPAASPAASSPVPRPPASLPSPARGKRAWAVLRGAGARVGPADSEPSRILY